MIPEVCAQDLCRRYGRTIRISWHQLGHSFSGDQAHPSFKNEAEFKLINRLFGAVVLNM